MTRAVGDDNAMMQSLVEVASLFEKAQNSIFKLMSSVSYTLAIVQITAHTLTGFGAEVHQASQVRTATSRP